MSDETSEVPEMKTEKPVAETAEKKKDELVEESGETPVEEKSPAESDAEPEAEAADESGAGAEPEAEAADESGTEPEVEEEPASEPPSEAEVEAGVGAEPVVRKAAKTVERIGYWTIVWNQLQRNKLAMFGVYAVVALIAIAVFAPIAALNRPFVFFPPSGVERPAGALMFPWLFALFDVNFFENGVDFFFNTAMVLSPVFLGAWWYFKKEMGEEWPLVRGKFVAGCCALHMLVFCWFWMRPSRNPFFDYRGAVKQWQAEGKSCTAVFPPVPYSFREVDVGSAHPLAPSAKHPMGTDKEGRDVMVRMLYGTRISLTIGVVAVAIYVSIGILIGATAGFFGGWVDMLISRMVEIVMCFPSFFLILTLAAFIEQRSIFHVMAIIGLTRWTGVARLVRGEFLRQRGLDYVQAAKALGLGRTRIMFGHVLPNAIAPVLVSATFGIAGAILTESSLSFLGLGDKTAPSWGGILAAGRVESKLWLILIPGFAIFFVVSVFNLVGDGLRDALDPKQRQ